MASYSKAFPDAERFQHLPRDVFETAGGTKKPLGPLLLAWLYGGRAWYDREIELPNGREMKMVQGQAWGSMVSAAEDIFAATGVVYSRRQITYQRDKLIKAGLVDDDGNAFPETRGAYGKLYRLPEIDSHQPPIDTVRTFRALYYGDPREFRYTEMVVGRYDNPNARGKEGVGTRWEQQIAARGLDRPSFLRLGRWRRGEVADAEAPVVMPWVVIDLDREHLPSAFVDAQKILWQLGEAMIDLDNVFVAFSGRRGFHIYVPTGKFGSPIFASTEAARLVTDYIQRSIAQQVEYDPATNSPLGLIRVMGSTHEKTGNKKRGWTAKEFIVMEQEEALSNLKEVRPITLPDPLDVEEEWDASELLERAALAVEEELEEYVAPSDAGTSDIEYKSGGIIEALKDGVNKSEKFADGYAGRDSALFLYARYLTNNLDKSPKEAEAILQEWNKLNNPPLPNSTVRSKVRWVQRYKSIKP